MNPIRRAGMEDLERIAEIEVFNYRLYFYPIFRSDEFFFNQLRVSARIRHYETDVSNLLVWDDGTVKGFCGIRFAGVEMDRSPFGMICSICSPRCTCCGCALVLVSCMVKNLPGSAT